MSCRLRVCVNPECGVVDEMEEYPFAGKRGRIFTYTGDMLAYSLLAAPTGMNVSPSTGLIDWTPGAAQVGPNAVTVREKDREIDLPASPLRLPRLSLRTQESRRSL